MPENLLIVNKHGTIMCNPELSTCRCTKMTGQSCVGCEHFNRIRMKLYDLECDSRPAERLVMPNNIGCSVICPTQDDYEAACQRSPDMSCQRCHHFLMIRQKLFNLETGETLYSLRTSGTSATWYPAWKPPQDGKYKLLHVWNFVPVQFVQARYDIETEEWIWCVPEGLETANLAPVAWADLPAVPQDILDAYTEDAHLKRKKKNYSNPKVRTMGK